MSGPSEDNSTPTDYCHLNKRPPFAARRWASRVTARSQRRQWKHSWVWACPVHAPGRPLCGAPTDF